MVLNAEFEESDGLTLLSQAQCHQRPSVKTRRRRSDSRKWSSVRWYSTASASTLRGRGTQAATRRPAWSGTGCATRCSTTPKCTSSLCDSWPTTSCWSTTSWRTRAIASRSSTSSLTARTRTGALTAWSTRRPYTDNLSLTELAELTTCIYAQLSTDCLNRLFMPISFWNKGLPSGGNPRISSCPRLTNSRFALSFESRECVLNFCEKPLTDGTAWGLNVRPHGSRIRIFEGFFTFENFVLFLKSYSIGAFDARLCAISFMYLLF